MKVQDLAKELGQRPKEFIRFLGDVNVKVKSGSTKLDDETTDMIRDLFQERKSGVKKKKKKEVDDGAKVVHLKEGPVVIKEFALKLEVSLSEIMKVLLGKGLLLNLNSEIDYNLAIDVARSFDIELCPEESESDEKSGDSKIRGHMETIEDYEVEHDLDQMELRPAVITIMGHVDHGKTLLLDTIRKTNVVDKEAGGITQHIGAYQVVVKGQKLTFLDTPGHEAFTTLRARGAQVTDIAVLVVAADEGVKPQTIEAINHAKAAKVPIIVAINKCDRPEANPDNVKQMLTEYELVAEEWGGKTVMVNVSAKTGEGIDDLLEMLQLISDMHEFKANPKCLAKGIVIESRLSRKKGPVATVLVMSGTLSIGDNFVIGHVSGKVRALLNEHNENVKTAGPGTPVEIMGISEVPRPGDMLEVKNTDKEARSIAQNRLLAEKETNQSRHISFENMSQQIEKGEVSRLNLVVKADVNGSLEAVINLIEQISTDHVSITIYHSATGPITENDVMLAKASEAIIVGFNVPIHTDAETLAEEEGVQVKSYSIIYEIIDDVKRTVDGMFIAELEPFELGQAEVRQLFKFSKVGVIAGSYITSGKLVRNAMAKVTRGSEVLYDGKLSSLKRFKEDTKEVLQGYECGIVLDGFTAFKEKDVVICYEMREKPRK